MCLRWPCAAQGRRRDRSWEPWAPPGSFDANLGQLGRVVAEDVDDLHDDRVVAGPRILVPVALSSEHRFLARAIRLPLIMEDVIAEVEVHRPVVDEIRPRGNALADLLRN